MPAKSQSKRLDDHIRAVQITKKLMRNPRFRNQHKGTLIVDYSREDVEIEVIRQGDLHTRTEEFAQPKEGIDVNTQKKKLTKEEKKALHKKLAGSAQYHTKEGIEELLRIANREDWED